MKSLANKKLLALSRAPTASAQIGLATLQPDEVYYLRPSLARILLAYWNTFNGPIMRNILEVSVRYGYRELNEKEMQAPKNWKLLGVISSPA